MYIRLLNAIGNTRIIGYRSAICICKVGRGKQNHSFVPIICRRNFATYRINVRSFLSSFPVENKIKTKEHRSPRSEANTRHLPNPLFSHSPKLPLNLSVLNLAALFSKGPSKRRLCRASPWLVGFRAIASVPIRFKLICFGVLGYYLKSL